jgi:IS4 transposase
LRRIRIFDPEHHQHIVLLTNDLKSPASTISLLYCKRWQVELFFKWVKQHLRLIVFLGRSDKAVRCQVWAAVCVYLLVMIAKKQWALTHTLHRILQTVSISPFEQVPLPELITEMRVNADGNDFDKQLSLRML